ncbi:MAG: pyridoxal phosphate-dependent aminotransferase [Candidatus Nanoarchaeia archaeon]
MTEIPDLSPSFFLGKNSKDVISFGSGQPDLPPPKEVYNVKEEPGDFKYGSVEGLLTLREKLAGQYPESVPDSFIITNGASEALDLTLRVLSQKGKKILLPRPYYYSYPFLAEFAGMEAVYTDLKEGKLDIEDVKKKIGECTAMIINSPSNPTGSVEAMETLHEIEKLSEKHGTYIISDEVYKDIIYERKNYLIKGPKVVTVNSFSKTYSMCSDRIGFLWSRNKELIEKVKAMKTHTSMSTNVLGQKRALAAMMADSEYVKGQLKIWHERRELMLSMLNKIGLVAWKPEGAFYVLPRVENTKKVVWELYNNYKVVVYRGEWFGAKDRIRLSYALDKEKIIKGMEIIGKYLGKL